MKTSTSCTLWTIAFLILFCMLPGCGNQGSKGNSKNLNNRSPFQVYLSDSIPEIDRKREPQILTAFFGLDNALPPRSRALYRNAPGQDGMPLVFSHELDHETLDGVDFAVTTQNGTVFEVEAATLLPANEEFELRTALLIGEYGNYPENPPVMVKVIGDLMSRTGHNFKGDSISVIPLKEGPILSYAEYFKIDDSYPYVEKGDACDCPKDETELVVRAVWAGGVRAISGKDLGQEEAKEFTITLVQGTDTIKVHPYMLADLNDNENNIDLCLRETGIPILIEVNENVAIDPNDDKNPKTQVEVVSRW
ncbi:MAG: hypothetical protein AAFY71_08575 [Bacteroidota bacterium]